MKQKKTSPNMLPTRAYCFASGHIRFGTFLPDGALPLGHGDDKKVREFFTGLGRRLYDGDIVVGDVVDALAESSDDQMAAVDALSAWCVKVAGLRVPAGVHVIGAPVKRRRAERVR